MDDEEGYPHSWNPLNGLQDITSTVKYWYGYAPLAISGMIRDTLRLR